MDAAAIQWRNSHDLYGIEAWELEDVLEWCNSLASEFSQVLCRCLFFLYLASLPFFPLLNQTLTL